MINMVTTTSQRQGRRREAGCRTMVRPGSPRQSCEPTDRKLLRGRISGASQHPMAKPSGSGDTVNDPGVQREFTLLSGGDLSHMRAACYGSRTEDRSESDGETTESYGPRQRGASNRRRNGTVGQPRSS